ncbi:RNA methyltransferase [Paracandidimonas soli]|jgi:tRNA/rRNA methyltransferase|uniref:RNA methyltransferase n=1 Tax=Paracandidimonas soli TaxID=1917182 RepID=UPI000A9FF441
MVRPSHPGNVGAAARAIKTMGFSDLRLVAPKQADVAGHPEAHALASGATDVLAQARIVPSLTDALESATLSFAMTARPRVIGPPTCDIREAARLSVEHLRQHPDHGGIAIVLGTERAGLENDDVTACQYTCHIPANPEYSSLNVAQALQLSAWELRYALLDAAQAPLIPTTDGKVLAGDLPAAIDSVHALLRHLEQALVAIRFLDPAHPKKLVQRMHRLLNRAMLSMDEVDMLRGMCTAMIKTAEQAEPGALQRALEQMQAALRSRGG